MELNESAFLPLLKSIDHYLAKADDDMKNTLKDEGFAEPEKTVDMINAFEEYLADIFDEQRDYYIKGIEGKDVKEALDALPRLQAKDKAYKRTILKAKDNEDKTDFAEEFSKFIRQLVESYIKGTDKDLSFSTFTKRTTDWIDSWSKDLGDIMKLSTDEGLKTVLSDALENGDSIRTVADKLQDWYGFSAKRAMATAKTEMLTAHSAAAQEAYVQSPAVSQKMWRHTGAYKNDPRQNHMDDWPKGCNGQVVAVEESFTLIGAGTNAGETFYPMYPRDPILPPGERVNCHCISQPVVSKDVLGLDLKERKRLQQEAIDADDKAWEAELNAKNKAKAGIED
jgi:hypothetical protein